MVINYTYFMGIGNSNDLSGQRLLADGFVEIRPIEQAKNGWWSIAFHHARTGRVLNIPGQRLPVIETRPIIVTGVRDFDLGKIGLTFCMLECPSLEGLNNMHEELAINGRGEFLSPIIGANTNGINLRQGFNEMLVTVDYLYSENIVRLVAPTSIETRGIIPFIEIAESCGSIELGFNSTALQGLVSIAKDLSNLPEGGFS